MSWQATTWALTQKVGSPARKLVLITLCNYADEHALAWPGQKRLAVETEQSVDTVQRHLRRLEADGFIQIWERRRHGGHWPGRTYRLNMPRAETEPQNAARPTRAPPGDRAASCGPAVPHNTAARPGRTALRHDKSDNNHLNSHALLGRPKSAGTLKVGNRTRRQIQELQHRAVRKLGNGNEQAGWLAFGELTPFQRQQLEDLEAEGKLDRGAIERIASPALARTAAGGDR